MRIVTFPEFLALPVGTVYSEFTPYVFGAIYMKLETITHEGKAIDFFYRYLTSNVGGSSSDDAMERIEKAQEPGQSVPLVFDSVAREGLFDPENQYAVWSSDDVQGLINALQEAIT